MRRSTDPGRFLSPEEARLVAEAVAEAELRTSAELKLVLVRHCWDDIRRKAARTFRKMGLERTAERNCAMILLVTANREFLIYGDRGINERVGAGFWTEVRDAMAAHFREERFGAGLVGGIRSIGARLAEHFPRKDGDRNELPDEVSHEE